MIIHTENQHKNNLKTTIHVIPVFELSKFYEGSESYRKYFTIYWLGFKISINYNKNKEK